MLVLESAPWRSASVFIDDDGGSDGGGVGSCAAAAPIPEVGRLKSPSSTEQQEPLVLLLEWQRLISTAEQ